MTLNMWVLTSGCLMKGFHLIIHLLFSSIIIPFLLPPWKCYHFHITTAWLVGFSPSVFFPPGHPFCPHNSFSNVALLAGQMTSRNSPCTVSLMTSTVNIKPGLWTTAEMLKGQVQFSNVLPRFPSEDLGFWLHFRSTWLKTMHQSRQSTWQNHEFWGDESKGDEGNSFIII